jgi:DNA polymerase (family 10)
MLNQQISDIFAQMADIMEILGQDAFRVNTYRKVARVVHDSNQDIATLAADSTLEKMPGIGKSSAEKIHEFVHTGTIQAYQDLLKKIPPGLPDLLAIPGMGPKGVAAVWKGLKVESIADLQKVIDDHSLETLPGFGAKKAQSLAKGIAFLKSTHGRILLSHAEAIAETIMAELKEQIKSLKIEIAGSVRRGRETIGDIDLLAQAKDGQKIMEAFTQIPGIQQVISSGQTKASILYANPNICSDIVQVDLRVVKPESMGAAWQYFTGSQAHNVHLREIAVKQKLKLNEYGLFKGEKQIAGKTEPEIYEKLGLAYITPPLREDRGEIELAQTDKLPSIVSLSDMRGDLHMHSPESDGRATIDDLAEAAQGLHYEYIAITDHSKSSAIANGLDAKRLLKHIKNIKKINDTLDMITILASSEVDILANGSLDYPDEILQQLDFVMASVHSGMTGEKEKLTRRICKAMENPYVNCIGHPTGRMLNIRDAMQLDMSQILRQAAATGTAMEISSNPLRLDLNDIHCRMAIDAGVKLIINTDSHDVYSLQYMKYGVTTAQRGWAKKSDILNCQPLPALRQWIQSKRKN